MTTLIKVGAATPRRVTSGRDNGRGQPAVEGEHEQGDGGNFAAGLIAAATARAAQFGITVSQTEDAIVLRHTAGADIGIVCGIRALGAAVAGFEAAHRDVAELVRRMRRSA